MCGESGTEIFLSQGSRVPLFSPRRQMYLFVQRGTNINMLYLFYEFYFCHIQLWNYHVDMNYYIVIRVI